MKAKEKAWQLYSNYFDIIENGKQEGNLGKVNAAKRTCCCFHVSSPAFDSIPLILPY